MVTGVYNHHVILLAKNDDAIIDEYDVTHYDRHWVEPGKSVKLKFYRAEAFGASYPDLNNVIFETVINV